MQRGQVVLVDTNVIIEAFRAHCWNAVTTHFTVESGWAVLTFWGRQILRNSGACEAQIWQCYQFRRITSEMNTV